MVVLVRESQGVVKVHGDGQGKQTKAIPRVVWNTHEEWMRKTTVGHLFGSEKKVQSRVSEA